MKGGKATRLVNRSEVIVVRHSNVDFPIYIKLGYLHNNLHNLVTYNIRQPLIKAYRRHHYGKIPSNKSLRSLLRDEAHQKYPQNILYDVLGGKQCEKSIALITSTFYTWIGETLPAFHKNPKAFHNHKPHMPNYNNKGTFKCTFELNNQVAKLNRANNTLQVSSSRKNSAWWKRALTHNIQLDPNVDIVKLNHTWIKPERNQVKIIVSYKAKVPDVKKDNGRYMTIDPGGKNFQTVCNNCPQLLNYIIPGGPIRSLQERYNASIDKVKSKLKKVNNTTHSHYLDSLYTNAHNRIDKYIREACKRDIAFALNHGLNTIIIGNGCSNSMYKSNMGRAENRTFCGIPFGQAYRILKSDGDNFGITVKQTEESYTSQSSFLDREFPCAFNGNNARKKRRIKNYKRRQQRGDYVSNNGTHINADVDGALQISKKLYPHLYDDYTSKQLKQIASTPIKVVLPKC